MPLDDVEQRCPAEHYVLVDDNDDFNVYRWRRRRQVRAAQCLRPLGPDRLEVGVLLRDAGRSATCSSSRHWTSRSIGMPTVKDGSMNGN